MYGAAALRPSEGLSLHETIRDACQASRISLLSHCCLPRRQPIQTFSAQTGNGGCRQPSYASSYRRCVLRKTAWMLKTRALEFVHSEDSWATGLKQLLDVLTAAQCPRSVSGGIGIALRSFMPPDVISHQAETLYSNRFQAAVPDAILRFTATTAMEDDRFYQAQLQWAFRRVDSHSFLAFHPPPDALWDEFGIRNAGGASWRDVPSIDGILTHHLAPELLRKSLTVECIKRGLQFCDQSHLLYFPRRLVSSDRLYFKKPDGNRSFVSAAGRRTYWRAYRSMPYRYHLAPVFSAETLPSGGLALFVRVRARLTDDDGIPLKGRTIILSTETPL